jgi:hypothetical protein|tara:strand:- start:7270 stop:7581 length:312 start_codon:yes stop_codon:yes gene_type:complete
MIYKRNALPQISEKDLVEFDYTKFQLGVDILIPSQMERVPHLLTKARMKFPKIKPIIVDIAYNIINGHHRYDIAIEEGIAKVPVLQVQTTIEELIIHFVKNKS